MNDTDTLILKKLSFNPNDHQPQKAAYLTQKYKEVQA